VPPTSSSRSSIASSAATSVAALRRADQGLPRIDILGFWRIRRLTSSGRRNAIPHEAVVETGPSSTAKEDRMPGKRPSVKNEKQYEKLKEKGMSKERAARIANSPDASSRGGKKSGSSSSSRSNASQGGTTAQKKAAGRKGGRATARKSS
jgi:hypothetical protein